MRIIADDAIPYAREAFGPFGELELLPGRQIDRATVADADVLLVRSRTRVDAELLAGSRVRFVGSTVAGLDHVDQDWLADSGVHFYSAQGCNANSVAEYLTAALVTLAVDKGLPIEGRRLAVIGVGHVGRQVAARARALGLEVWQHDPPRAAREPGFPHRSLEACLEADALTLHVPLEHGGPHPTAGLIDARRLAALAPHGVLINAARGGVVDETAWREAGLAGSVVDCWNDEPRIDTGLLDAADIATPHIAGHSLDAKVNGTRMAFDALCRFFGIERALDLEALMPDPRPATVTLDPTGLEFAEALDRVIRPCFDLRADDRRLRAAGDPAGAFEDLRRNYPVRREWHHHRVRLLAPAPRLARALAGLGFVVEPG